MRLRTFAVLLLLSLPLFAARSPATTIEIRSKVLGSARTVLVSPPERYERAKELYPVLYMTDGAKHFDFTVAAINALAVVDRMPPLIVLAIPHADRMRKLTPTHVERMMRSA